VQLLQTRVVNVLPVNGQVKELVIARVAHQESIPVQEAPPMSQHANHAVSGSTTGVMVLPTSHIVSGVE
jgi:hypothetical protein